MIKRITSASWKQLWLQNSRQIALFAMVAVFAGIGIYFLRGSNAEVVNDSGAVISLAPQSAKVKQGSYINIAVNVDTQGTLSKSVKAVVEYPAQSLQLQSIEQSCPQPVFNNPAEDTSKQGVVSVGCDSADGFSGKQTVAYLVFKGVGGGGEASLTVRQGSTITSADGGRAMAFTARQSRMTLQPHDFSDKRPRPIEKRASKPTDCANPEPGKVKCRSILSARSDGQRLDVRPEETKALGPHELHMAYQLPCKPGGPVETICPTPSKYERVIAIVNAGAYKGGIAATERDLQEFNQTFGLPPCTLGNGCLQIVGQTGSYPPGNDEGWTFEMAMDLQAAHAICQTCKKLMVNSNSAYPDDMDKATKYAGSLKPYAISLSWGGEGETAAGESPYYHPGTFVTNATGDFGVSSHTSNIPADYGSVLAVGGTTLQVNEDGTWASETVWSGSGGGCSPWNVAPAWQIARADWKAVGCGNKRAYGDMSAVADPNTGMYVMINGEWWVIGGTSLSAPVLAGIAALAGPIDRNTLGASVPYARNNGQNTHDIHVGDNCIPTYTIHCRAGFGFDTPTGLGSPSGVGAFGPTGVAPPPPPPPPPAPPTPPPAPADTTKPGVSVTAPTEGETVSGTAYQIRVNASDDVKVASVSVQVDGGSALTDNTSPYELALDTTKLASGSHTLTVTATDTSDNRTTVSRGFKTAAATPPPPPPPPTVSPNPPAPNPNPSAKPGDLNKDGKVNITDLSTLLSAWGKTDVSADLTGDGKVNISDLSKLLSNWG